MSAGSDRVTLADIGNASRLLNINNLPIVHIGNLIAERNQ
jgi:hypothetical protein